MESSNTNLLAPLLSQLESLFQNNHLTDNTKKLLPIDLVKILPFSFQELTELFSLLSLQIFETLDGSHEVLVSFQDLLTLSNSSLIELNPLSISSDLIHGTNKSAYKKIKTRGLFKMQKNFIYFSPVLPDPKCSIPGSKVKNEVFIFLNLENSLKKMQFFCLNSSVIFTKGLSGFISPFFFSKMLFNKIERPLEYSPLVFDYYLVIDLDANCSETKKIECQEVIEFPLEIINGNNNLTEFWFHRYVRPEIVPNLTEFCIKFTGITQESVDKARGIAETISTIEEFLKEVGVWDKKWVIVTCGEWDLGTCLKKEMNYKNLAIPDYLSYWLNIKKLVPGFKGTVVDLCKVLGIDFEGNRHHGIDDCRNSASCLKTLLGAGVYFSKEDISGDVGMFNNRFS